MKTIVQRNFQLQPKLEVNANEYYEAVISPIYLLPHQMIVTPDQVGSSAPSHHRPSIKRQSLDGQLKHIESGRESDCYCHHTQPNIKLLTSKFEYF